MADKINPALIDHAKNILQDADLPVGHKATIWDWYHDSADANSLARKLESIALPGDLRERLIEAKRVATAPDGNAGHIDRAFSQLKQMDPKVLDLAEKHSSIARALIDAAMREK
jgi:hypothetical protein